MKTLLKSVHIYQSYCKKNSVQFFLAHPVCHMVYLWNDESEFGEGAMHVFVKSLTEM